MYGPKTTWKYFVPPGTPFPEEGIEYQRKSYFEPWNLPADEVAYGYDNIGEALTLPPHLMESYFEVAAAVTERVLGDKKARPFTLAVQPGPDKSEAVAVRETLATLARRAFRRPVTNADMDPLVKLFTLARARSESFDEAMKVPLQAMLVSPDFLFRVERGADPAADKEARPLNDHELASRLSYFLWGSMPDAELFRLADRRQLSDPKVLEQQVRRMLRDPKAEALAEHFAPQWLQVSNVQAAMPDPTLFPAFYRRSIPWGMHTEVIMFFDSVVVEDRSILDLVAADSTYLNAYMAEYYGIIKKAPVGLPGFGVWKRYPLPPGRRAGVLTMAAVATATATPTRSSPVKRGKWVLETILGDPPPPPPPDVEELKEGDAKLGPLTFRQKLERHRTSATCAACHQHMDPIGFSLENLDAIGRWREREGAEAVDATGTLKDGTRLQGPEGLRDEILSRRKDDFARCLAEHLLIYALGRNLEWYDQATVDSLVQCLKQNDYRFSTLVVAIAQSRPFRYMRQAD
jgi:cytochrome c553